MCLSDVTVHEALVEQFLNHFSRWASAEEGITGGALVGSRARGTATETSDVDLIVLVADPQRYLLDTTWVNAFGPSRAVREEHYGNVTSLRVYYASGLEIEFGLTDPRWPDSQEAKGIMRGMKVLFERGSILSRHHGEYRRRP